MAKLDLNAIKLQIATQKGSVDAITRNLDVIAEKKITEAKNELIEEFINHPVSQEIEDGPEAENISGTLNGKGNLFTFIGFPIGEKPVEEVVGILDTIQIDKKIQGRTRQGRFKAGGDNLLFDYSIIAPSKEYLADQTPLPWEPTKSWLFGIEQGIAGFTSYIYWKKAGRSTQGLQANDGRDKNGQFNGSGKPIKLRDGRFNNIPYFSAIYNNFIKKFK